MPTDLTPADPTPVLSLLNGFRNSQVLFAACELGLFDALAGGPKTGAALAAEMGLTFPLLSDADGQVINRFGTRNGYLGGGSVLPHPSVFVIDNQGVIRFRSVDRNYKKRTTIRTILGTLATLALDAQPRVDVAVP